MIYLLDALHLEIFERSTRYRTFHQWETTEAKVKGWIENERTRSIIGKQEVVNQFAIKQKIQVATVKKIKLQKYDKIIIWTASGRYFVFELIDFKN